VTTQRTHRNWQLGNMVFLILALAAPAMAQQQDATELAKKTQNPVADLISVPLQSNINFDAGVNYNKMIYVLNVQPVIPARIAEDWNLITGVIMPIINQPNLSPSIAAVPSTTGTGFGDFNPSFFFSPAKLAKSFGVWAPLLPCRLQPIEIWALANGAWGRREWR